MRIFRSSLYIYDVTDVSIDLDKLCTYSAVRRWPLIVPIKRSLKDGNHKLLEELHCENAGAVNLLKFNQSQPNQFVVYVIIHTKFTMI